MRRSPMNFKTMIACAAFLHIFGFFLNAQSTELLVRDDKPDARRGSAVLKQEKFQQYIDLFNQQDCESITNFIPNAGVWGWMTENVPFFECPDKEMERTYYFRWWTYRKHIKATPDGFVVTEFLPLVDWAKKFNTINCPVGHQLYEGRWLRDPKYMDGYTRFYFGGGGDPGGVSKHYSNWIVDGIYARFLVNVDRKFVLSLLDALVANHEAWSRDGASSNHWQKSRRLDNGLYWQVDSREGQEYSIGGTGMRPPINSYMFGGAVAISHIAELAGKPDLAARFRNEAERLRELVQQHLWDNEAKFFKTIRYEPLGAQYKNSMAEACDQGQRVKVREIFGYVPWYFNLPADGKGYEEAWRQLTDPQGFLGAYGPTVTERRHPDFFIQTGGCMWCGASWPFSTSQTLTALANLLNNYTQNVIGPREYFDTLSAYARSHNFKTADGNVVPWVDESVNPDTGRWILGGGRFPDTRGRYYNHSTFCDLIITGLVGLRPRADSIVEVNPLVPEGTWDWFCLDNIGYHGRTMTILWDKTGQRYGKGAGLRVFADGKEIASADRLTRLYGEM